MPSRSLGEPTWQTGASLWKAVGELCGLEAREPSPWPAFVFQTVRRGWRACGTFACLFSSKWSPLLGGTGAFGDCGP